jgi:hypothetical protein
MRVVSIAALAVASALFFASATQAADLSLFQNGNPNPHLGSTTGVALVVSNAGPALGTSSTIIVTETLPTGLTQMTAGGSGWSCTVSGNTATCTRPPANYTQGMTLQGINIGFRAQSTGTFQSCATVTLVGPDADTVSGNNHSCFTIAVPPPQGQTCLMNGNAPRMVAGKGSDPRQDSALIKAQTNWSSTAASYGAAYSNFSRAQHVQTSCNNSFPATCTVTAQPCP